MAWKVYDPYNSESPPRIYEDVDDALDDLLEPPKDYLAVKEVHGTEHDPELRVDDREGIKYVLEHRGRILVLFQRPSGRGQYSHKQADRVEQHKGGDER